MATERLNFLTSPERGKEERKIAYVRGGAQVLLTPSIDWIQLFMELEMFLNINLQFWDIQQFLPIFSISI